MQEQTINPKNPFMQYKTYLEDLSNIIEICTKKCVNNYNDYNLNTTEKLCLEKCYIKTIDMNQYVADEYSNILTKQEKAEQSEI